MIKRSEWGFQVDYRREIDGLRAFAVVPVILFHAGFSGFSGGYVGVDIFFVISGYLITTLIIREMHRDTFSISHFYERRARRILPSLFFVMLCSTPVAWFTMTPTQWKDFSQSLAAVSLYASNMLFWVESGYFGAASELKPLLHTWSLAVEEQYYVVFPLLLSLTWLLGKRWLPHVLAALALSSFALCLWLQEVDAGANFYFAPTRAWEFLAGALVALYLDHKRQRTNINPYLSLLGLFLIVLSVAWFDEHTPFPSLYTFLPVAGTTLIILDTNTNTITARILSLRALVGVGLISYSVYLWHQPLFAFARIASESAPSGWVYAVLIVVSMLLGAFSWRFVERPFRSRSNFSRAQIFSFALLGSGAFVFLGWLGHSGALTRELGEHASYILKSALHSPKRSECHTRGSAYLHPRDGCEYFSGELKWAVFGDSHAVELAHSLASELSERNESVLHLSFSDCAPALLIESGTMKNCADWTREAIDEIVGRDSVENVVVAYRLSSHLDWSKASATDREVMWQSLRRTIERLAESKTVFILLPVPDPEQHMEQLAMRHERAGGASDGKLDLPGRSRADFEKRNQLVRDRLLSGEFAVNAIPIDPSRLTCDDQQCYAVRGGVALYFDGHHLSLAGASLVAREIIRQHDERRVEASEPE